MKKWDKGENSNANHILLTKEEEDLILEVGSYVKKRGGLNNILNCIYFKLIADYCKDRTLAPAIDILNTSPEQVTYHHLERFIVDHFTAFHLDQECVSDEVFIQTLKHKLRCDGYLSYCPVCGGTNPHIEESEGEYFRDTVLHYKVLCENKDCNEFMRSVVWDILPGEAIQTWNKLNRSPERMPNKEQ